MDPRHKCRRSRNSPEICCGLPKQESGNAIPAQCHHLNGPDHRAECFLRLDRAHRQSGGLSHSHRTPCAEAATKCAGHGGGGSLAQSCECLPRDVNPRHPCECTPFRALREALPQGTLRHSSILQPARAHHSHGFSGSGALAHSGRAGRNPSTDRKHQVRRGGISGSGTVAIAYRLGLGRP